jgi:hypothetical protein
VTPAVFGSLLAQGSHVIITVSLGKNRGGCNGKIKLVPLNNGGVRDITVRLETVSVDDDVLRHNFQFIKSPVHGENRSIQDVYLVNFRIIVHSYSPGQGLCFYNGPKLVTLFLCELFGIVKDLRNKIFR